MRQPGSSEMLCDLVAACRANQNERHQGQTEGANSFHMSTSLTMEAEVVAIRKGSKTPPLLVNTLFQCFSGVRAPSKKA